MNLLVDDLKQIIKSRIKIDFNTDFRICIMFELLMQDNTIQQEAKINQALTLFYPSRAQIKDINKAINDILWFYACGKKEEINTKESEGNNTKQIYSYEFDDEYIYSAFMEQYKIDLNSIEYLHWWKFKALFNSLNENTHFAKIMGYRAMNISKIKDKEMKSYYKKMQKLYSLPDMRTPEEKEADFGKIFW